MGLIGSLFGGAVGFVLGGPLGAIAGAAIGHGLSGGVVDTMSRQEQAQATYFISVFSMLAKMARADGVVSQHEIDMVQDFMRRDLRLDPDAERAAIKVFRTARDSPIAFEEFAQQFHDIFRSDRQMLLSMIDLLHRLGMADGELSAGERELLEDAARIFQLHPEEIRHVVATAMPALDKHYAVLGLSPEATPDQVKSRYRKLVTEVHPDKVIAKGLPDEFVEFAHQRFREVQEAYDAIRGQWATT
jgi:DnaJ like chaperone protein